MTDGSAVEDALSESPTSTAGSFRQRAGSENAPPSPQVVTKEKTSVLSRRRKSSSVADKDKPLPQSPGSTKESKKDKKKEKKEKNKGADEKKELMERMQPPKGARPTDMAQQKGDRWERDPTTGLEVLVKDLKFEGARIYTIVIRKTGTNYVRADFREQELDNASLDPEGNKTGTALHPPPSKTDRSQDPRYPAPAPAAPGNILLQQFPPPIAPTDISHAKAILRTGAVLVCALCALAWFSVATGPSVSWLQFAYRTVILGAIANTAWIASENAGRKVEKEVERMLKLGMEMGRGVRRVRRRLGGVKLIREERRCGRVGGCL